MAYLRSAAPWITVAVGALVITPHLVWLYANDFLPFTYATAGHERGLVSGLVSAPSYLAGAAAYVVVPVLLALAALRPSRDALVDIIAPATPQRRFAATAFWAPLLLPALVAPLAGVSITGLWSMPAWALLPVVLLSTPLARLDRRSLVRVAVVAVVLPPLMIAAAPAVAIFAHRSGDLSPAATQSRLLAQRVAHEWRRRTDRPLRTVAGEADLALGVAFYLPGRPMAYPDFNRTISPWIDPTRLRREGIAIVCQAADSDCLRAASTRGLSGPRVDVEIARYYFGMAGRSRRYAIIIVPPGS